MDFTHGLFLGFLGISLTIIGFTIAYIVYERNRKNIERTETDKEKKNPYDFS